MVITVWRCCPTSCTPLFFWRATPPVGLCGHTVLAPLYCCCVRSVLPPQHQHVPLQLRTVLYRHVSYVMRSWYISLSAISYARAENKRIINRQLFEGSQRVCEINAREKMEKFPSGLGFLRTDQLSKAKFQDVKISISTSSCCERTERRGCFGTLLILFSAHIHDVRIRIRSGYR